MGIPHPLFVIFFCPFAYDCIILNGSAGQSKQFQHIYQSTRGKLPLVHVDLVHTLCVVKLHCFREQISYLLAEGWGPSCLTIIYRKVPSEMHGMGFAMFTLVGTISGNIGITLVGICDQGNGKFLGKLLLTTIWVSYFGSGLLFACLHIFEANTKASTEDRTAKQVQRIEGCTNGENDPLLSLNE